MSVSWPSVFYHGVQSVTHYKSAIDLCQMRCNECCYFISENMEKVNNNRFSNKNTHVLRWCCKTNIPNFVSLTVYLDFKSTMYRFESKEYWLLCLKRLTFVPIRINFHGRFILNIFFNIVVIFVTIVCHNTWKRLIPGTNIHYKIGA